MDGEQLQPTNRTYHTYTDLEYDLGMVKMTVTGIPARWDERLNDHVIDGPLMLAISNQMAALQKQAQELEAAIKRSLHATGEVRDGSAAYEIDLDSKKVKELNNAMRRAGYEIAQSV